MLYDTGVQSLSICDDVGTESECAVLCLPDDLPALLCRHSFHARTPYQISLLGASTNFSAQDYAGATSRMNNLRTMASRLKARDEPAHKLVCKTLRVFSWNERCLGHHGIYESRWRFTITSPPEVVECYAAPGQAATRLFFAPQCPSVHVVYGLACGQASSEGRVHTAISEGFPIRPLRPVILRNRSGC